MTAAALRAWRAQRGLSRAEFARRLPAPVRTVEDWEADKRTPPKYLGRALADMDRELSAESTTTGA